MHTTTKKWLSISVSALLAGLGVGALAQRLWEVPFGAAEQPLWEEPPELSEPLAGGADPAPARLFWGLPRQQRNFFVADALAGHVHRPGATRTYQWPEHSGGKIVMTCNNLGFRDDAATSREPVPGERRIIITGDSHTDGVVENSETFPNVLEGLLRSDGAASPEVINGGVGHYGPHNYLGFLKDSVPLKPDVFCITLYIGNDFVDAINTAQVRRNAFVPPRSDDYKERLTAATAISRPAVTQALNQVAFFKAFPWLASTAVDITVAQILGAFEICERNRIQLVVLLLPTKCDIDWRWDARYAADKSALMEALQLSDEDLEMNTRLAEEVRERLGRWGIPVRDLSSYLGGGKEPYYWDKDYHLNVRGHQVVAEGIARSIGPQLLGH